MFLCVSAYTPIFRLMTFKYLPINYSGEFGTTSKTSPGNVIMDHLLSLPLVQQWPLQLLLPPGVWALSDEGGHLSVEPPPVEESVSLYTVSGPMCSLLAPPTSHSHLLIISRT